ncbi:MAG TPA: hypothetical protein VGN04_15180 [Herbaspirillum sp.]
MTSKFAILARFMNLQGKFAPLADSPLRPRLQAGTVRARIECRTGPDRDRHVDERIGGEYGTEK